MEHISKKYVQNPHYDIQTEAKESDIIEILQKIFARIVFTEENLQFGTGSSDVEGTLARLRRRVLG